MARAAGFDVGMDWRVELCWPGAGKASHNGYMSLYACGQE